MYLSRTGLNKLANIKAEVKNTQETLERMKSKLEKATETAARMISKITQETVSISNSVKESFTFSSVKNFLFHDVYKRYNLDIQYNLLAKSFRQQKIFNTF